MSQPQSVAPESRLRESLIEASREAWKNRLIDLSRRNSLLFYRPLVNGTLELPVSSRLMQFILEGGSLAVSELLPGQEFKASNIRAIARKGLENLEEKGLSTLYMTLGKCSWTADDGGRDAFAPIVLLPIHLKLKGQDVQSAEIEITSKPEINPVLLHVLNEELNVTIGADELLQEFWPESDEESAPESADPEEPEGSAVDLHAVLHLLSTHLC